MSGLSGGASDVAKFRRNLPSPEQIQRLQRESPGLFDSGLVGILFSGFVVVIAALNLVLDFDLIERGAAQGAPKYMEWYGAFALLVTLIWLYIEILRLLAKLRDRR